MFVLSAIAIFIINKQLGIISIFLAAFLIYTTYTSLKNNRAYTLSWQANNDWILSQYNISVAAKLSESSVVTPVFTLLNFKLEDGKRQSVLIFKDSIDAESFRRLRVRVKVQGINPRSHATIKL